MSNGGMKKAAGLKATLVLGAAVALLPQPKGRRMPVAGPVTTTHTEEEDNVAPDPDSAPFDDPAESQEA